jgi:uncharacterized protein (TIGR00156 family)
MKKIFLLIIFLFQISLSANSFAYYENYDNAEYTTVNDILNGDNYSSYVKVRGFMVKQITHDVFLFDDDTGRLKVKITERMMQDLDIDARTRVVIRGYINRLEHETNIIGESIELAN